MDIKKESGPNIRKVEWFDDRYYRIERNGSTDYYVSVTTKLSTVSKPFLAKWRGDIGNREADLRVFEASERGTRIHSAWETFTTGGLVLYQPHRSPKYLQADLDAYMKEYDGHVELVRYQDEMLQVNKLAQLWDILKPEQVGAEVIVFSDKYREAGTADNIWKIKEGKYPINGRTPLFIPGGTYIVDLKSGKVVDDDAYMQTASYGNSYSEMNPKIAVDGTLILHTGSSNKSGIMGLGVHLRNKEQLKQDFQDFRAVSTVWERKHPNFQPNLFEFPALLTLRK